MFISAADYSRAIDRAIELRKQGLDEDLFVKVVMALISEKEEVLRMFRALEAAYQTTQSLQEQLHALRAQHTQTHTRLQELTQENDRLHDELSEERMGRDE